MMVKPKHQRLALIGLAVVALLGAVLLAMWGLRDSAAYFATPSDITAGKVQSGKPVRLGGLVVKGSLKRDPDGLTVRFMVSDTKAEALVMFRGITPDLFREGSGVVAEGRLDASGLFIADNILAKHDERYMPPEIRGQ